MNWTLNSVAFVGTVLVLSAAFAPGQEPKLNAEATGAIAKIQAAGGRAMRIAANTNQFEASYHLASPPVKDANLEPLKSIPELIWLNLANTEITNDGLKNIASLPLKKLHLEKTQIGDDGLQHLKGLRDLEYLNIYATKVGDAGLQHLKGLTKLRKLYVWQSAVSEAGINDLQSALPELVIVGEMSLLDPATEKSSEEDEDAPKADKVNEADNVNEADKGNTGKSEGDDGKKSSRRKQDDDKNEN